MLRISKEYDSSRNITAGSAPRMKLHTATKKAHSGVLVDRTYSPGLQTNPLPASRFFDTRNVMYASSPTKAVEFNRRRMRIEIERKSEPAAAHTFEYDQLPGAMDGQYWRGSTSDRRGVPRSSEHRMRSEA